MDKTLEELENEIIQNYNSIQVAFFEGQNGGQPYWQYESHHRIKLSPEVSVGSLLCYSVKGNTRLEACQKLYKAIKEDTELSEKVITKYNVMKITEDKEEDKTILKNKLIDIVNKLFK